MALFGIDPRGGSPLTGLGQFCKDGFLASFGCNRELHLGVPEGETESAGSP